jgi:hypothetical protein
VPLRGRSELKPGTSVTLLTSFGHIERPQVPDSLLVGPLVRLLLNITVMQVPVTLLRGSRTTIAEVTHLPLRKLALCLDCDACFELGAPTCPACGSRTWSPLARFIDLLSEPRTHRANGKFARRTSAEGKSTARYLLIVARQHREFYDNIRRALAGHERVQVILDRRVSQRRQAQAEPALEGRRDERRSTSAIDEQLRSFGWALVPLDAKPRR